jgi:hypothetical protein
MQHHPTLIGGGKGEGSLFCSKPHKIIICVANVLTRIVYVFKYLKQIERIVTLIGYAIVMFVNSRQLKEWVV